MKHLQPSSFSDLMELVPGGKSADPQDGAGQSDPGYVKQVRRRISLHWELDFILMVSPRIRMRICNICQNSTSAVNATSTMSKGIDMRTISTDNIEKVEIIRGIPSVAYGNVANGAVIIQRKMNESPLSARLRLIKPVNCFL